MGAFPSSDVISFFQLQLVILTSRFEPCSRPGGFPTSSNSHTVAVFCSGCTKIPISSGKGSGGRDPSSHRRLRPCLTHMGAFPSSDVISFFQLQLVILTSRFEPCSRPGGFPTSSNSHTVAVFCSGCTK